MIKFPNLENYISDYNNPNNIICLKFIPTDSRIRPKILAVSTPFVYGAFAEFLTELFNQMQMPIKVVQIDNEKLEFIEHINMWQLHWFMMNIKNTKTVDIAIKSLNNTQINMTVDLNDEKELSNLMYTLKNNAR